MNMHTISVMYTQQIFYKKLIFFKTKDTRVLLFLAEYWFSKMVIVKHYLFPNSTALKL